MLDRRFRRVWDSDRLPAIDAFDPGDDGHVDELACLLLERFARHGDTEAFALLFAVAGQRLEQIAGRIARRLGAATAPSELVDGLKRRLWIGEGWLLLGGFLALARGLMERQLAGGGPPPATGAGSCLPAPVRVGGGPERRPSSTILGSLSTVRRGGGIG